MARLLSIVLLLAVLCAGPGWAFDAALPSQTAAQASTAAAPIVVAQDGQTPVEILRLETPERRASALDRDARFGPLQVSKSSSPASRSLDPLGSCPASPALHLRLCVFLC